LKKKTATVNYCDWLDVVESDLISIHVPFTQVGEFPTENLLDTNFFAAIDDSCVLLNAARGEVCDELALLEKLSNSEIKVVLDVWNNEPDISEDLLSRVDIASPHIAGYSLDAKLNATEILANKVYEYFHYEKHWKIVNAKEKIKEFLSYDASVISFKDICKLILLAYNPIIDTENLRNKKNTILKTHFDKLRKNYNHRFEWSHYDLSHIKMNDDSKIVLEGLDFYVGDSEVIDS